MPQEHASGAVATGGGGPPDPRARQKGQIWPSRASSREIDVTSPDATADDRDRRRTHETHLERRGSLQSEEMATNRARARTSSDRHGSAWFESPQNGSKSAQNLPFESLLGCFKAAALATSPIVVMGRSGPRRHGLLGPRRAPEVPIRMTLKEPKISTFATIILNRKRVGCFFLLHTASQLQCGAGGALRLSGGASYGGILFTYKQKRPKYPM